MLRTRLVDLLGIQHPIIQAGMGTFGSGAALAAAVSSAGAIGTIGAAKRSAEGLREELGAFRELTASPFIVNFRLPWLRLYPECLDVALAAGPRAISVSAGLPGELTSRIHDHGALVIAQIHSREQAALAADEGVDMVIAQGAEAGGYGASIGSLVLIPQVVDAVAPLPVVAAGGIADGRGLAAVLLLGATGANIGTRFLATTEAALGDQWKRRLIRADSDEQIVFESSAQRTQDEHDPSAHSPSPGPKTSSDSDAPIAGQVAGSIRTVVTAAEVVDGMVREAEETLLRLNALVVPGMASALDSAGADRIGSTQTDATFPLV